MPDIPNLAIFVAAAIALLITPGPAVLYIVGRSIEQGRTAGFVSTLGIALGSVVHVTFAALGLSALLVQSAIAFTVVKYAGAAYLIILGIRTLSDRAEAGAIRQVESVSLSRVFAQGLVVNLLNPKAALFFFAFLPQFVSPESGPVVTQVLFLGALFIGMAIVSDGMYALVAGTAAEFLSGNVRIARLQKTLAGTIYLVLGITTAVAGSGRLK